MNKTISIAVVLSLLLLAGCDTIVKPPTTNSYVPSYIAPITNQTVPNTTVVAPVTNRIGSFNVQVLGITKQADPTVRAYLPSILQTYDLVVVQELREGTGSTAAWLVGQMPGYTYKLSPRLGRTTSKEQYIIIYNNKVTASGEWTFNDTYDVYEREPYGTLITMNGKQFVLLTIHVDPDNAENEIRNLQFAIPKAQEHFNTQDFILVGDLNADCTYYNEELYYLKNYNWVISNNLDTTTRATDCAYDRIITNTAYVKDGGVDHYDATYSLTQAQTEAISDHYPVYATIG